MTAEILGALAGSVLSLIVSYVPGVEAWFNKLPRNYKQGVMGILIILVAAFVFGMSCSGFANYFTCDKDGLAEWGRILWIVLVSNQGTYLISRK